ncbi:hypothetical protein NT2_06_02180 [Caenibius tardaugens NBRC 16725]|uniref:Uncharacterized protein n=1 Tax=Caenibius tardaugens NBRC 16725 TaxID=1219035 RepID=U3A4V4_9SPHN|nr:hypothetical protein [Caenibius tardaugens]AZI37678.1 hypothetical protein EGO55_18295 [Caenibius tardaugens NBRC 16725]GAD49778.1 hypothetical protein NT2_06_02180 [Caenibius tardaugens NBRC 16725]
MDQVTGAVPIACTLDRGGLEARMTWIADLNTRALKAARRGDLQLELDYAPAALADVRQMMAQEQQCCAFLSFDIAERENMVTLAITAPEGARDAAEQLFASFQEKAGQSAACGCASGCGA